MIVFDHVEKSYERNGNYTVRALKGVTLHVSDGEFVFLVGNSGSGKSTMLNLLLRSLKPTAGSVMVDGMRLERMPQRKLPYYRRKLGVVFQDFRLLSDRSVYENVALAKRVVSAPSSEIKKDVTNVLNMVGLSSKYKNYPPELSGGEQQRVAIARALINQPEIILCDEPTGNLDPQNSREIMNLLLQANETGTTVLVVTHNMGLVSEIGKRVVTLKNGLITGDNTGLDCDNTDTAFLMQEAVKEEEKDEDPDELPDPIVFDDLGGESQ